MFLSIGGWSGNVFKDATDAITVFVEGNSDVALFTPVGVPGVSDDHELLLAFLAVADGSDSVIDVGATLIRVKDTAGIELEVDGVAINADASWLLINGCFELGNTLRRNLNEVGHLDLLQEFVLCFASSAKSSLVRIGLLELETCLLRILECVRLKTTIAALVTLSRGAVNKLLLRELQELALLKEVRSFHCSDSRESPARPTIQLTLNRVDSALGPPVNSIVHDRSVKLNDCCIARNNRLPSLDLSHLRLRES